MFDKPVRGSRSDFYVDKDGSDITYLDFQKAFDLVFHHRVFVWHKRKRIENYLKERKLISRLHNIKRFPEPTKISAVQHLQKFYEEFSCHEDSSQII